MKNLLDDRHRLDHSRMIGGFNRNEHITPVSSYIKVEQLKARIRESEVYLCNQIDESFKLEGIVMVNRFVTRLNKYSPEKTNEILLNIEKSSILEVIISEMKLEKIKKTTPKITIPKIFDSIELDGNTVTSLDQLLKLIAENPQYIFAPCVSKLSRQRGGISFGYENRHTDKDFTLQRFMCLRGYKELLIKNELYQ